MPLTRKDHFDAAVGAFLRGLLPDNDRILGLWGRRFGVSPRNPFALLEHMGTDCPGGLQFVHEDRAHRFLSGEDDGVEWHTDEEVGELLFDLARNRGIGRTADARGYFSLAGAQPKTALIRKDGRWGTPSGRIPTTHILKPPTDPELPDVDLNEHYCLTLADELGMAVAKSRVVTFDQRTTIVIERFDRIRTPDAWPARVHQEDLCQAMGVPPDRKYQSDGGPGPRDVIRLLRDSSDEADDDVAAFIDALALNWVIGGSDAHAKNFAILMMPGSRVELAPLFDVVSVLPYPEFVPMREVRLAMRIGSEYRMWRIGRREWVSLAEDCEMPAGALLESVVGLVRGIPVANANTFARVTAEGFDVGFAEMMREVIDERAGSCLESLGG